MSGGTLRVYPGSPLIALALMRPQDRLIACELEPRAAAALKAVLRDRRAKVLVLDGWTALGAYVPPKERRGVVLVDPPFEEDGRFHAARRRLGGGAPQMADRHLFAVVSDQGARRARCPGAAAAQARNAGVLRCEITMGRPRADAGLVGSGLIVINPPFKLDADLKVLLPALAEAFAAGATSRIDWLAARQITFPGSRPLFHNRELV